MTSCITARNQKTSTLVANLRAIADQIDSGDLAAKAGQTAANELLQAHAWPDDAELVRRQKNAAALAKRIRSEADAWEETLPAALAPEAEAVIVAEDATEAAAVVSTGVIVTETPDGFLASDPGLRCDDGAPYPLLVRATAEAAQADGLAYLAASAAAEPEADEVPGPGPMYGEPEPTPLAPPEESSSFRAFLEAQAAAKAAEADEADEDEDEAPEAAQAPAAAVSKGKASRLASLLAGEKPAAVEKRPRSSVVFCEVGGEPMKVKARLARRAIQEHLSDATRAILAEIATAYSGATITPSDAFFADAVLDALHGKPCPGALGPAIEAARSAAETSAVLQTPKGGTPRAGARVEVILSALREGATVRQICERMAEAYPERTARHGGGASSPESFEGFVRTAISHLHGGRNFSIAAETKGRIARAKNEAGDLVYKYECSGAEA